MPKQNRSTLKSFFGDGAVPTSSMFRDFIDSTINLTDDGFEKNNVDGVKITCHTDSSVLSSYYHQQRRDKPVWQVGFDGENNNLMWFTHASDQAGVDVSEADNKRLQEAVCFSRDNNRLAVGIGTRQPDATLDVNGSIHCHSRRGRYGQSFFSVPADSQWHTIVDNIQGGSAFEIVARAQNLSQRRYAIMHAIAMHCPWKPKRNDFLAWLGIRNPIKYTQVFHDSVLHRLKLRWLDDDAKNGYKLQIRSNCYYGREQTSPSQNADSNSCVIDFHITRLWDDSDTFVSLDEQARANAANE